LAVESVPEFDEPVFGGDDPELDGDIGIEVVEEANVGSAKAEVDEITDRREVGGFGGQE